MQSIKRFAAYLFLTMLFIAAAHFESNAVEGAMKGVDPTHRGGVTGVSHGGTGGSQGGSAGRGATCSAAVQRCQKAFPASAAACRNAGGTCKQTGTFTNPH